MTQARGKWVVQLGMPSILRRRRRVTCTQCGASHPAVYKGQRCLICGATIAAASRRNDHVGNVASENQEAQERHRVENAASEAPRADPSAPPAAPDREVVVSASDYERYVRLAARDGRARQLSDAQHCHHTRNVLRSHGRRRPPCH